MASRAKKISEYAIGVLSAGNTYFLGNVAGVTKRIAALASNLTFTPAGGIAATNVQAALEELDSEKFDKSGGTITGMTAFGAGLKLTGPATLGAAAAKEWSYEHPITRYYFGDGSGYSFALSKRVGGATTDMLTLTDTGNLSVAGGLDVSGNITARLPNTSHSTPRGLKFGVTLDGSDYGGVTMRMDSGEVRYTAGFSGWGGFHTWYANGAERARLDASGNLGVGTAPAAWGVDNYVIDTGTWGSYYTNNNGFVGLAGNAYNNGGWKYKGTATALRYEQTLGSTPSHKWERAVSGTAGAALTWITDMTLDASGNLLVGATSSSGYGDCHRISRGGGQGVNILTFDGGVEVSGLFQAVSGAGANTTDCALRLGKNSVTGRSINAGGTINASGADAAEYRKNNGLTIAKGQIVGYRHDGTLTLTWSEATMARVKSTDPHIVGGDTWGTEEKVGARPVEPKFTAPQYTGRDKPEGPAPEPQPPTFTLTEPAHPGANASPVEAATYVLLKREYDAASNEHSQAVVAFEDVHAAWASVHEQYLRGMADWRTDQVEYETRVAVERDLFDSTIWPEYQRALQAFESRLEEARRGVDRIAYCGIVPCNVTGATPGHYIVAAEGPDDTIIGLSVRRPTDDQWPWVVGRCLRVLPDGRAEIDVMLS